MNARDLFKECATILEERGKQYGEAKDLYEVTAKMIGAQLGIEVTPWEACLVLANIKLGRIANGDTQKDTYLDVINYIALAWEVRQKSIPP